MRVSVFYLPVNYGIEATELANGAPLTGAG